MDNDYILEMRNVDKSYGGVHALKDITLKIKRGEVHALVGENGAGKSTLVKILSGAVQSDKGVICIDGEVVKINNPSDAQKNHIGIIYQEFTLVPSLSIAENIFLDQFPKGKIRGIIEWKKLRENAREALSRLDFNLSVERLVSELSVAYQQMVEITKATSKNVKILVLDEPTAVLAPHEVEKLFNVIALLKQQGVTMIYISHKLDEIFKISDSISVLKDGNFMGTVKTDSVDRDTLISMMIGRKLESLFPKRSINLGETILDVKNISGSAGLKPTNCSLYVRKGEVVGLSGLVASGRTELVRCIFGADPISSGEIFINGEKTILNSPVSAVKCKIGLVPEDRKNQGVILSKTIRENITMPNSKEITIYGIIKSLKEKTIVRKLMEAIKIKALSEEVNVGNLSGGNQQKVVLAKWFCTNSDLVILDEPTRGVDVGAKYEIYKLINQLAEEGKGIIIISSELEEVIGMCDRVYVLREGKITGELDRNELGEGSIMKYAI